MANITPTPEWSDVYQLATTDDVLAGPEGLANIQAKQMANRTEFLKSFTATPYDPKEDYPVGKEVFLYNGDIVKNILEGNPYDPNINLTGWVGTGLKAPFDVLRQSISRSIFDHSQDYVNVLDYGAINDGAHHSLQEWVDSGKFSGLESIQEVFPFAQSLSDCINTTVFHHVINLKKIGYAPKGAYAFIKGKSVHTPHSGSPNRIDSGGGIIGDGCLTMFTQLGSTVPSDDEDTRNNEAIFSIHGAYSVFRDFTINASCIGFYLGQDLTKAELSAAYLNSFDNIQIRNTGAGVFSESSFGNHYNRFNNIHFIQNRIDCRMVNSSRSVGLANNNRNQFTNIRSNRSIVGLWCSAGDTNRFDKWDGEGCGTAPNSNPFNSFPVTDLPGGLTTAVHVLDGIGQLNKVSNSQMEACEVELYSDNYANSFMMNGYHENEANGTKVYMPTPPAVFISAHTTWIPFIKAVSNINLNAFPSKTNFATILTGSSVLNDTGTDDLTNRSFAGTSYKRERIFELKAAAASSIVPVTLWADVDPNSAASIEVIVTGRSSASNLSFSSRFLVTALRSNTRSLTRYFLVSEGALRATGQGVGDSSSVITGTLTNGGSSTRELILNLGVPAYAISDLTVWVNSVIAK